MIDGLRLERGKRFPSGASTVNDCSYSGSESETIWRKSFKSVTEVVIFLRSKEIVGMYVDESGCYKESLCINYLGLFRINVLGNQGYLVIFDSNIHHLVDLVFGIDHVSTFDNNRIILGA